MTGFSTEVRRRVMQTKAAGLAIQQVILRVETFDLMEFAFACSGGTHRSVALASILVSGVYHLGTVQPTSRRTAAAAASVTTSRVHGARA